MFVVIVLITTLLFLFSRCSVSNEFNDNNLIFSERLWIFFTVLTNSDHSGDNVALESVAHRLHGDN